MIDLTPRIAGGNPMKNMNRNHFCVCSGPVNVHISVYVVAL